jgi:hypothetical protein
MILYDLVQPAVLTGFVRELPVPTQIGLNRYLPDRQINDIEALIDQVTRTNRAAKFRAFDAETPIGKRDTFQRSRVKLPPLGQKTVIGEYERLQLARLEGGNANRLTASIFDDAEVNTNATRFRMELARGDVLTDGKVTISENGLVGLEADFGLPGSHLVSAAVVWSDHTNSDPLNDLTTWLDVYADDGGTPGRIVVSQTGLRHMLANQKIRDLAAANGVVPSTIAIPQLNAILESRGLPPVEVYNGRFDVDGVTTRALPNDRLLMLPQNPTDLGYTAWGITAEALELAEAQRINVADAPGLVAVVMKTFDPVSVWTKVGGVGMPIIANPLRLLSADIF